MKTNIDSSISKTLGKKEALLIASLLKNGLKVFTVQDAYRVSSIDKAQLYVLLHSLKRKGWVEEIEKGKYVVVSIDGLREASVFAIATSLVWPSYVSFLSALNYYGFTEQVPRCVFVVTTKRKDRVVFRGIAIRFVRFLPFRFFGYMRVEDFVIAEREKALVDSLYMVKYVGLDEISKCLFNATDEISMEKLVKYAVMMRCKSLLKRLGFLLELLEVEVPQSLLEALRKDIGRGYSLLYPSKNKKGIYDKKWQIIVNVPLEEILGWKRI